MSENDLSTTSAEDRPGKTGLLDDSETEGIAGGVGNPVKPEPIDKNEGPEEWKGWVTAHSLKRSDLTDQPVRDDTSRCQFQPALAGLVCGMQRCA